MDDKEGKRKTVAITVYEDHFDFQARAVFEAVVERAAEKFGYSTMEARGRALFLATYENAVDILGQDEVDRIDEQACRELRRQNLEDNSDDKPTFDI